MLDSHNILPYDGEVYYSKRLWNFDESQVIFKSFFIDFPWRHDELIMFGKKIVTNRKVVWFGDEAFQYT